MDEGQIKFVPNAAKIGKIAFLRAVIFSGIGLDQLLKNPELILQYEEMRQLNNSVSHSNLFRKLWSLVFLMPLRIVLARMASFQLDVLELKVSAAAVSDVV